MPTLLAALSEGQLTLNNVWTQADLDDENIDLSIRYQGQNQPEGRVRSYTTLVQQYRVRRKQCEADAQEFYPRQTLDLSVLGTYHFRDRKCYPQQTDEPHGLEENFVRPGAKRVLARYGYYCGAGISPFSAFGAGAPEPLDGVDYCCRLHDAQAWNQTDDVFDRSNECGIAMCLAKATGLPANVLDRMPDVKVARDYWYGGAATACGGNQTNDPPVKPGP